MSTRGPDDPGDDHRRAREEKSGGDTGQNTECKGTMATHSGGYGHGFSHVDRDAMMTQLAVQERSGPRRLHPALAARSSVEQTSARLWD